MNMGIEQVRAMWRDGVLSAVFSANNGLAHPGRPSTNVHPIATSGFLWVRFDGSRPAEDMARAIDAGGRCETFAAAVSNAVGSLLERLGPEVESKFR